MTQVRPGSRINVIYSGETHPFNVTEVDTYGTVATINQGSSNHTMRYRDRWLVDGYDPSEHRVEVFLTIQDLPLEILELITQEAITGGSFEEMSNIRMTNMAFRETVSRAQLCSGSIDQLNKCLIKASEEGDIDLVNELIRLGANNWNRAMANAAKGGHRDLVNLFIEKGANNWNEAMANAAKGGHRDLVDLFIEKGANWWNRAMANAAEGGHRDLVNFFIEKGADDWDQAMFSAAEGGHRDLVDLFIEKGANWWNRAIQYAAVGGHRDLANYLREKRDQT